MTQPAKSQEPSMEEILASIRRIIADDDAGKSVKRASEVPTAPEVHQAFAQPAVPPRPSLFAPPEPSVPEVPAEPPADPAAMSRAQEDHATEILDLTESMTARMLGEPVSAPVPSPVPDAMSQFRELEPTPEFHELELAPREQEPDQALQFHESEPPPQTQESDQALRFHESEPPPQHQEPDQARQFHEPEPAPQDQEYDQAPQFQEPEPEPTPQTREPDQAPQFRVTEGYADEGVEDAAQQPAMRRPAEQAVPYVAPETAGERTLLLSSATSAAVDSAFNALAHTVLVQNARTLEDLVREMLRPMLKTWLDDNLPGMVERLVRAEIERVARGRP